MVHSLLFRRRKYRKWLQIPLFLRNSLRKLPHSAGPAAPVSARNLLEMQCQPRSRSESKTLGYGNLFCRDSPDASVPLFWGKTHTRYTNVRAVPCEDRHPNGRLEGWSGSLLLLHMESAMCILSRSFHRWFSKWSESLQNYRFYSNVKILAHKNIFFKLDTPKCMGGNRYI